MASINIDYEENATIVTNPVALKGKWRQLMCLSNCTGVTVVDKNLTAISEQWSDDEFVKTAILVGNFTEITLTGKVVLYG